MKAVQLQSGIRLLLFVVHLLLLGTAESTHAQLPPVLEEKPFKVKLDLSVGNTPLSVERVVACEMRMRMHPGPDSSKPQLKRRPIWASNVRNFYTELSDGSVLVIYTPLVCDEHTGRIDKLPRGYIPTMVWLSSKRNFQQVEFFISPTYFKRADARVVFKGMQILNASPDERVERDKEFERLRLSGRRFDETGYISDRFYVGVFVLTYPENVWRERPALAAHLGSLTSFTRLEDQSVIREVVALREYPNALQNELEGKGIDFGPRSRVHYLSAMQLHNNEWKADRRDEGVVRLHYMPDVKVNHHRLDLLFRDMRKVTFSLGAHREEGGAARTFYDPATRQIHFVSLEYLIW